MHLCVLFLVVLGRLGLAVFNAGGSDVDLLAGVRVDNEVTGLCVFDEALLSGAFRGNSVGGSGDVFAGASHESKTKRLPLRCKADS